MVAIAHWNYGPCVAGYDLSRHRNALALLAEEPKKRRSKAKERLLTHGAADSEEHLG